MKTIIGMEVLVRDNIALLTLNRHTDDIKLYDNIQSLLLIVSTDILSKQHCYSGRNLVN